MRVGIVICNYNKADMVEKCIQAVAENDYSDYDLYVVDNGSTDESVYVIDKALDKYFNNNESPVTTQALLIKNKENLGGSGGFNTGLRAAMEREYEYLMCIDNDAFLDEHAIGQLVRFLDQHTECGIAASKIYHLENPDYVQNFGQNIDFEYFCTSVEYLNAIEDGSMPEFVYTDSVPACSLMIRKSVIEKIGLLPEENFLYWDDTEWCYLCNQNGYRVASVGSSQALHSMGAKKEAINTFPTYYAWRNWIAFFIKYTPEEKIVDMVYEFLSSIYQEQYIAYLNEEYRKAETVMAAFDDAIHGVTGKAGTNRIFELDHNENRFLDFCKSTKDIYILTDKLPELAEELAERYRKMGKTVIFAKNYKQASDYGTVIEPCVSILSDRLLEESKLICDSREHYFIDVDGCISSLEDLPAIHNEFLSGREVFIIAETPLFIRQCHELRGKSQK